METYSKKLRSAFDKALCFIDPTHAYIDTDDRLGVVLLDPEVFLYRQEVGYAFETAVMESSEGGDRLLFVRIDAWDPVHRAENPQIDYCIPMAYKGASEAEQLRWKIPFGGAWSDTWEVGLIVFDERWRGWLRQVEGQLAFTNPGGSSAALFRLGERHQEKLEAFLG